MVGVVLIIKRNNVVVFIPKGTTQVPKLVNSSIFFFSCLQVISNLITSPRKLEMLI